MYFEVCKNKKIRACPLKEYRYNLNVDESCYAVCFIFNNVEYTICKRMTLDEANEASNDIHRKYGIGVDIITVTRVTETTYEYKRLFNDSKSKWNYGTLEQEPFDQFAIHGRNVKLNIPKDAEQPDEFTIGASYYVPENGARLKGFKQINHNLESNGEFSDIQSKYLSSLKSK